MSQEVRYAYLQPGQIADLREARSVAYLPIGTLEWHGPQNPVGLDTLKMEGICIACAQAHGGVVFPPLWYGENREQAMMEANNDPDGKIAEGYRLPKENFAPGYMRASVHEQSLRYHALLLHALFEVRSYGFKVICLGAGHYPLIDHARAAAAIFRQHMRGAAICWPFTGFELVRDEIPRAGDHAGKWETSLMMAVDESTVDLSKLPPDKKQYVGMSRDDAAESSVAFGAAALEAIVRKVGERVEHLLAGPHPGHGAPLGPTP